MEKIVRGYGQEPVLVQGKVECYNWTSDYTRVLLAFVTHSTLFG